LTRQSRLPLTALAKCARVLSHQGRAGAGCVAQACFIASPPEARGNVKELLDARLRGHDKGGGNDYARKRKVETVGSHYTVGLVAKGKADRVAVDAEDALIAALKVKTERPDATITYVRRQNRRGDARHPAHSLTGNRR
jgi:hypothetical protein